MQVHTGSQYKVYFLHSDVSYDQKGLKALNWEADILFHTFVSLTACKVSAPINAHGVNTWINISLKELNWLIAEWLPIPLNFPCSNNFQFPKPQARAFAKARAGLHHILQCMVWAWDGLGAYAGMNTGERKAAPNDVQSHWCDAWPLLFICQSSDPAGSWRLTLYLEKLRSQDLIFKMMNLEGDHPSHQLKMQETQKWLRLGHSR